MIEFRTPTKSRKGIGMTYTNLFYSPYTKWHSVRRQLREMWWDFIDPDRQKCIEGPNIRIEDLEKIDGIKRIPIKVRPSHKLFKIKRWKRIPSWQSIKYLFYTIIYGEKIVSQSFGEIIRNANKSTVYNESLVDKEDGIHYIRKVKDLDIEIYNNYLL